MRDSDVSFIGSVEDDEENEPTQAQAKVVTHRMVDAADLRRAARGEQVAPERRTKLELPKVEQDELVEGGGDGETVQQVEQETILHGRKPSPKKPPRRAEPEPEEEPEPAPPPRRQERTGGRARPSRREPEPEAPRPVSDPGYRPPKPASPSRSVPRPTLGIEDVDPQGAAQVSQQMEQSGRSEEAVAYLERAIERWPDAAPLYNRLAVLLDRDFADHGRAEQVILAALKLSPGNMLFTRTLNNIRQHMRDARGRRR